MAAAIPRVAQWACDRQGPRLEAGPLQQPVPGAAAADCFGVAWAAMAQEPHRLPLLDHPP